MHKGAQTPIGNNVSSPVNEAQNTWEKRRNPRITVHSPATVRGVDTEGKAFKETTEVENLSAHGLYMRIEQPTEVGTPIFVMFRLVEDASNKASQATAPRIAVRGKVHRVEPKADGNVGVVVVFQQYRFI